MTGFIPDAPKRSNAEMIHRVTLHYGDITKQQGLEALTTAIPLNMDMDDRLNRAVTAGAGAQLDEFILENIYKPRVCDVFAVPGFNLPVKYLFCAMVPNWDDTLGFEERDLMRCYRHATELARRLGVKRFALPAMGAGRDQLPPMRVARLALTGIMDRLVPPIEEVRIVCDRDEMITAFYSRLQKQGWRGKVVYDE